MRNPDRERSIGLRGTRRGKWKMASEQRTEPCIAVRLRQVSPVIAERVIDPIRSDIVRVG